MQIVGDYFILAPTHKAASVMASLNLTVFVYNYEYRSDFDQWEGERILYSRCQHCTTYPQSFRLRNRYGDLKKHWDVLFLLFFL